MEKWKFGIVGLGEKARMDSNAIEKMDNATLRAASSLDMTKRSEWLKDHACTTYMEYEDMLRDDKIDIVIVSSATGAHKEMAVKALEKKHHVIIESPMTLRAQDAKVIMGAEIESGKRCFVSLPSFYSPLMKTVWKAVKDKRLGKLISASAQVVSPRKNEAWRGNPRLEGGPAFTDDASDALSTLLILAGDAGYVTAASANFTETEADDTISALIEYKSGAKGTFTSTSSAFGASSFRMELLGTDGEIIIENGALRHWLFRDEFPEDRLIRERFKEEATLTTAESQQAQLEDILRSLENATPGVTNAWIGYKCVATIEAIEESAKRKEKIKVIL